ncbi:hypothetical protein E3N88_23724 [Mikania micrantha]|uniref:HAT C-terminal dimerisation domain-containing protein n=1 Tax=Mikania micrantha TaxID=192012 RepID=A0A5N6NFU3_9ASTR|nr:hypothetical protein E3N88_23724 [Mikania micrantha]
MAGRLEFWGKKNHAQHSRAAHTDLHFIRYIMKKTITLHSFFKRKDDDPDKQQSKRQKASTSEPQAPQEIGNQQEKQCTHEPPQPPLNTNEVGLSHLERDLAKRKKMWEYPANERELKPHHILIFNELMETTNTLAQTLQKKTQDILNAIDLVSSTKVKLNDFRNNGRDSFLVKVTFFCTKHQVEMSDMNSPYISTRLRPRKKDLHVTFEHYYRVDVFKATLDKQLFELSSRFNDQAMELLSLSSSLVSKEINVNEICLLVEKYYPEDFTEHERSLLRGQLEIFNVEMAKNDKLSGVSTISDLCKTLTETKKCEPYYLIDRVLRLILTLPVSTATTERGFSAMKIIKNRLRNKMSDEYLADSLSNNKTN